MKIGVRYMGTSYGSSSEIKRKHLNEMGNQPCESKQFPAVALTPKQRAKQLEDEAKRLRKNEKARKLRKKKAKANRKRAEKDWLEVRATLLDVMKNSRNQMARVEAAMQLKHMTYDRTGLS